MSAFMFGNEGRTVARSGSRARDEIGRRIPCRMGGNAGPKVGGDRLDCTVIPLSHSYGFSNLVTPLLVRGVPMVLSRDRMPRAVLDGLARPSTTVFAGMPVFYQAFCEMETMPALPKLRLCISAGAPLPLEVARKFREKFGQTIHSFYGSSEFGGNCYDPEARLEEAGFV